MSFSHKSSDLLVYSLNRLQLDEKNSWNDVISLNSAILTIVEIQCKYGDVIIRKMSLHRIPCFQYGTRVQISCHQDSPVVVFAEDLAGRLCESGFRRIWTNCCAELTPLLFLST